jgi:hypothetical protein
VELDKVKALEDKMNELNQQLANKDQTLNQIKSETDSKL